jgi:hypothetical protein
LHISFFLSAAQDWFTHLIKQTGGGCSVRRRFVSAAAEAVVFFDCFGMPEGVP